MKIIRVSNYDYEDHRGNHKLIEGPGLSKDEAIELAMDMNDDPLRSDGDWFIVVEDDKELFEFKP